MTEPARDRHEDVPTDLPARDRDTASVLPLRQPRRDDERARRDRRLRRDDDRLRRDDDQGRRQPEPLLRDILGRVIRQARQQQRRTLADVAEVAGVSIPYLSEIERGRKEPSSEMLGAVCRALDLDLIDLLSGGYLELIGQQVEVSRVPRPRVLRNRPMGRPAGHGPSDVLALAA